jgi:hypothetical protein
MLQGSNSTYRVWDNGKRGGVLREIGVWVLQKAEGDVKQYRKWFHAMCKYSREVLLAQQATRQAEEEAKLRAEDLALFLEEADNFVAKEKGKSARRRRKDAEGQVPFLG